MRLNLLLLLTALVTAANAQEAPVGLGTACNYVILAKSGISTVPTSAITGSIAVSPIAATAMTGFGLVLDLGDSIRQLLSSRARPMGRATVVPLRRL
jgi:hypothetical protein